MSIQVLPTIQRETIAGRIGKGLGQGLSEQLPREVERNRLSQGLKNIGQQQNTTPFQQFASLAGLPGVTPQMIQSGAELLKQQGIRQGFQNKRKGASKQVGIPEIAQAISETPFAGMQPGQQINEEPSNDQSSAGPGVVPTNPLREEALPKAPWSQQRKDEALDQSFEDFPNLTYPEHLARVEEQERRELSQSQAQRDYDSYLKDVQNDLRNKFNENLQLKLQKNKEGVFQDVTGEMINNLQRGMERDLRSNPKSNPDDVVNRWTDKALNLAKTKKQLDGLKNDSFWASKILFNRPAYLSKLESYADDFAKSNNSEEYYNILQSDFGLSPQGAARIAYHKSSKNVDSFINKFKPSKGPQFGQLSNNASKAALDLENVITPGDSILSILRRLRERDPYFDQYAFIKQLDDDKDEIGLTKRQRRELQEGHQLLPTWPDILILPYFGGE
jgi:hypothetical protein